MKKMFIALFLGVLFTLPSLEAQMIKTPALSPKAKVQQTVGLTEVHIEYSRPSMRERTIFAADGLVPFGEMWRTGANASTKIEFSDDVTINGEALPAGKYALYTIPGAESWTIIFHKNTSYNGTGGNSYTPSEDALRITAKPNEIVLPVETFTISVDNISATNADLNLTWENTLVSMIIGVEVESKVMAGIEKAMAGTSRSDYYTAARYYFKNDKDIEKAYRWVKKANMMEGKYWQYKLQSEIEAKMGDLESAIKSAERSKTMATEAGNKGYARQMEKNLADLKTELEKKS